MGISDSVDRSVSALFGTVCHKNGSFLTQSESIVKMQQQNLCDQDKLRRPQDGRSRPIHSEADASRFRTKRSRWLPRNHRAWLGGNIFRSLLSIPHSMHWANSGNCVNIKLHHFADKLFGKHRAASDSLFRSNICALW